MIWKRNSLSNSWLSILRIKINNALKFYCILKIFKPPHIISCLLADLALVAHFAIQFLYSHNPVKREMGQDTDWSRCLTFEEENLSGTWRNVLLTWAARAGGRSPVLLFHLLMPLCTESLLYVRNPSDTSHIQNHLIKLIQAMEKPVFMGRHHKNECISWNELNPCEWIHVCRYSVKPGKRQTALSSDDFKHHSRYWEGFLELHFRYIVHTYWHQQ